MYKSREFLNCFACSLCGSIAALFGKASSFYLEFALTSQALAGAACLGIMVLLNSVMLTFLVRAMHDLGTVQSTTVINAMNFCLSGVTGTLFFDESISTRWIIGILIMWIGIVFILRGTPSEKTETSRSEHKTSAADADDSSNSESLSLKDTNGSTRKRASCSSAKS